MKGAIQFLGALAAVQAVSATYIDWTQPFNSYDCGGKQCGGRPKFEPPAYSNERCTPQQNTGYDFSDAPDGDLPKYDDFDFSGYKCQKSKLQRRSGRGSGSKCASSYVEPETYSNEIKCSKKFSVDEFDISLEYESVIEFHYGMPDGSSCKHVSKCGTGITPIKNTQCGGAKSVKCKIHKSSQNKKKCKFNIHHIKFRCDKPSTTSAPVPATTSEPAPCTEYSCTATDTTTEPAPTEPAPTEPAPCTEYSCTATDTTTDVAPTTTDEAPCTEYSCTATETTSEAVPTTTDEAPCTDYSCTATEAVPTTTEEAPCTEYSCTGVPTSEAVPTTSDDVPTTTDVYVPPTDVYVPPTDIYVPPANTSIPYETPAPSETETLPPSGTDVYTTLPSVPVETGCPPVLPQCMETWTKITQCVNSGDVKCLCPNPEYIKSVAECVEAWGVDDDEVAKALEYMQGLCAEHIPENPAIVTCVPTYVTLPPVTTGASTVTVSTTVVVPVTTASPEETNKPGYVPSFTTETVIKTVTVCPVKLVTTEPSKPVLVPGTITAPPYVPPTAPATIPATVPAEATTPPVEYAPSTLMTAYPTVPVPVNNTTPNPPIATGAASSFKTFSTVMLAGVIGLTALIMT
ncbi:hypothetical protein TWF703_010910 [Orbilia oligospora]|uniref:CFEM domain-containing protein n=1 Tax=Orbilia oligospora TaxID=2813651 RepID=A0A7C8JXV3_ORBOL|nr:hypothetical protein TWF703_010910 [Orbilia oligospora]